MPLKIGVSTWSLLGQDVISAVRAIGDAGFEYIELWGEIPHAYPDWVDRRRLKDALSPYGMTVTTHAPFTDLNPATPFEPVKGAVERTLEKFVEFSVFVGASVVTFHPGSVHNEALVPGSSASSIAILKQMVKTAAGRLSVSVENMTGSTSKYYYPLGSTTEAVQALLSGEERLKFTLDTGHAHASGQDPFDFAQKAGPRLVEVHLSDNAGEHDDHLVPGEGTADLKKLPAKLASSDVLICLELNPHRYDPGQVLRAASSFKLGA
ncbi:MAG TPA: sugar phosphate isomerase/epimerase [Nitrososphaerales archaeon]|nr:sugar phosphate isomerase/epimerase [Nitrososphaerales archaeon]